MSECICLFENLSVYKKRIEPFNQFMNEYIHSWLVVWMDGLARHTSECPHCCPFIHFPFVSLHRCTNNFVCWKTLHTYFVVQKHDCK